MHWEVLATKLKAEGIPSRRARALDDAVLLSSFLEKQSALDLNKYMDLVARQLQVNLFALDKSPVRVPCVVCGQVP